MNSKNNWFLDKFAQWVSKYLQLKVIVLLVTFLLMLVVLINLPLKDILESDGLIVRTSVSEFGNYTGSGCDEFTQEYIHSFFPEQIADSFSNVKYSYKAGGNNTYGFEAFLEFSIDDTEEFKSFADRIADETAWEPFAFDNKYEAFVLDNCLDISEGIIENPESDYYHPIERAKIRIVLKNDDTQTIMFWALGVYDGGGIGTNFLNAFFDRFNIDPIIYEQTASSPYGQSPYLID